MVLLFRRTKKLGKPLHIVQSRIYLTNCNKWLTIKLHFLVYLLKVCTIIFLNGDKILRVLRQGGSCLRMIRLSNNFLPHTSQQTYLVFQDVFKTSSRRPQRNSFRLPRPLEDVFKTYFQ